MGKRTIRNPINTVLGLGAVAVLFFYLYVQQTAKDLMFQPWPSSYGVELELDWVTAEDGTKIAVYWREVSKTAPSVFYFHGNAEDIGQVLPVLQTYQIRGYNVACFDYRGFGLSEGKPSETNVYSDGEAVYRYLLETKGINESKLVLHGRSLGGGAAVEMARRFDPSALILESAFRSVYQLGIPVRWLPFDKFRNESKVASLKMPIFILHGEADKVVPISHGKRLAELVGDGGLTFWVPGAGHNDLVSSMGLGYWKSIDRFVGENLSE